MQYIEYADNEIEAGMTILHRGQSLWVREVVFRLGQGLQLFTRQANGYAGPVISPHPDELVKVISGSPSQIDYHPTTDYPHATRIMR